MLTEESPQGAAVEQSASRQVAVRPLPENTAALIEQRKNKRSYSLNDMVEKHHLALYESEDYQVLLEAVFPEQATEGSLIADDFEAARMIRDRARDTGDGYVAKQKLDTIRKALTVVLRRYGISRKERRDS